MIIRSFVVSLLLAATAAADHGHDFLLVHDVLVPAPGGWMVFANGGASRQAGADEHGLEFGATTGVAKRLGVMASVQHADLDGEGWTWAAAAAALHIDLTPAGSPVLLGLHLGREVDLDAERDGAPLLVAGPQFGTHHDGHDHPVVPEPEHQHSGIHQHGLDAWQARWVMEAQLGGLRVVGNLISLVPDGANAEFGYAIGVRQPLGKSVALGLEVTGDLASSDYQEATIGWYLSPVHPLTLKLGLGTGLTSTSPDTTLRAGAVWRF